MKLYYNDVFFNPLRSEQMKIKPLGITCIHNTGINLIDRNNMEKTLRDEIAIAAMQAFLSNKEALSIIVDVSKEDDDKIPELICDMAYEMANYMLEARKEKDNA